MELLYFPSTLSSQQALELGLATRVVPADDFAAEVAALAGRLASGPTVALRRDPALGRQLRRRVVRGRGRLRERDDDAHRRHRATTGAAVDAFVAKEKPVFEGR